MTARCHTVRCCGPRRADRPPDGAKVFNVTSSGNDGCRALSPFLLHPTHGLAWNVENYWQFSKVFPQHWDRETRRPTPAWHRWRDAGWERRGPVRHPMGRGAKPICAWIEGVGPLGYILSRQMLYIPTYLDAVAHDEAAQNALATIREATEHGDVWLWDFDTHDHVTAGKTIGDLIGDPTRPLGHGFLVWALVTGTPVPTPLATWAAGDPNE